ncbi:family 78 glycoside hydrolase catalytic domain [Mumia sp. DW29H23]|uniref:family 78 glycoside hydrolase catalytic domain n=1 Tax=Mumia sp. DW29H23 TaxID=3421241 RepID=UPI003D680D3B
MSQPTPVPRSRWLRTTGVAGAMLALAVTGVAPAAAQGKPPAAPADLRVNGLVDPLGIDDATPDLSWANTGELAKQTAYQIRVASSVPKLGKADLWDSGKVRSRAQLDVEYDGRSLGSRSQAVWQVRVWDETGKASGWSEPASWELGLTGERDWDADWITNAEWNEPLHQDIALGTQTARYVRLTVTDLGRPEEPLDDPGWKPRLELGEVGLVDSASGATDLATGAKVTVSENNAEDGVWAPEYLTDGKVTTADAPRGYRSSYHPETDVQDEPIVITIDLGEARTFDAVRLFPLWDSPGRYGTTPNYPRDVTVSVSADDASYTKLTTAKKLPAISTTHETPEALPIFAKDFTTQGKVKEARLYVTGLGVYSASINGKPVTEDVLEPANTVHFTRVPYATYDVTDLLDKKVNTIGLEVGNGIFNVFNTPADAKRYVKSASGHGVPRVMGQLELTYANGKRTTIATDPSWRTTLGDVTFTNWYGGEDRDARRAIDGWDEPGTSRTAWDSAVESSAPTEDTKLVGRSQPPIRQVDTLEDVKVSEPKPGTYVFDLGVNFAGWQQLTTSGPAGTKITMRPSERLKADGTVDQASAGGDIRDTFVLAGKGEETFTPQFVYHGFRYLQVEGLATAPDASTVKGLVLRADDRAVGSFSSSDPQLNAIHRIIDRSVQSNMYSVFTDCPHREKLGWLDQTNLVFDTVAFGYDVQAHYRKMLQDVVDAQQDNGLIPTTAPEDSLFAGAFRHDANWGATLAVSSWQIYQWYGDDSAIRAYWPQMVEYADFLARGAKDNIVSGGLGDWITPASPVTPPALTQTWAYHRILTHMSQIAEVLGKDAEAQAYTDRAADVAAAFHRTFFSTTTGLYGNGDQASQALALEEDLVPAELRQDVLDRFVRMIRDKGNHIEVGEIGLHAAVELLSRERLDDVLYDWTQQNDGISYGKFLKAGATSLPESWTNSNSSNNHYMLGAIDAWFTNGIAGIGQAEDSIGWEHVVIEPALVGSLQQAQASYESARGLISSAWERKDGVLTLRVEVPAGTTATVRVPGTSAVGPDGAREVRSDVDGFTQFEVGAGSSVFTSTVG